MAATEKVGIEVEILGLDEARKEMESFEHDLKSLNGFKVRIDAQNRLGELRKEAAALRSEMARLKTEQSKTTKGSAEWKQFANDMNNVRSRMAAVNAEIGRIRTGLNSVKSLRTVFNQISSSVAHMGSAMQSAGNAISRLMTPLRMLGTGAMLGAGFKAMNTVSEGLSAGFQRYDIMHKYPRMMKQFETANYSAEKSIKELEQSVLGLPTGLDEMVNLSQRFTMTVGDMKKGTDLAIATNNAFLASMSTDTQKYQGMMQLQDVLGGKKLNAREWQSLANSMMPAIRMMGEDLGKSGKELKEWVSDVQQGKISNEEFIKALKKTGTGMGKAAQMAEQSKDTWEAFASNTRIAFSRLTVGVIESMDEIVKVATGGKTKSLNMLLTETLIPGINNLSESVKGWIKAHPKEITDFFRDLKSIDWAGLAKGFAEGIGSFTKLAQGIAKSLSGKDLSKIGRIIFDLNVLGNGLLIVGGLFKGLRGVIATIGTVGAGLGRALGAAGFAGATSKLTGLLKFFKGFGKVGKAASTASKVAGVGGAATLGATFKAFIPAIEALAGVGAILTMATGIAALDTKLLSMAVNNMIKITDGMHQVFQNVKGLKSDSFDGSALKNAVEQMFQMWEVFSGTGETVDAHMAKKGGGRSIAQMDKKLLSDMADSMKSMSSILGSMALMKTNMKGLKNFKGFDEKMTEGITNFATALGGIYSAFETAFGGEGAFGKGAINPEQAQGFADIITSTETMFASLGKIVNKIPKVLTGLTNLVKTPGGMGESPVASLKKMLIGEDTTGGLFKDIHDIFQKLKDDFQNIDTGVISDKMGQVVTAIQSIRKIGNQLTKMGSAGTLNSEGIDTAISNIKSFISKLSTALDTTVVGDIQNKVGALRTTINGIFQALNTDLSNVEVTVNIKGEVKGADDLVSKINKAHTQITNAVRKIPSTITKTVTVNINGNVNNNLPNAVSSADVDGDYRGGYILPSGKAIYRKHGGGIPNFKPKGTDTVPAMLTPGEYVMKRSAVDTFGVRFMQRINNMDIRGAMRELSSRAGRIASINRGVTYNYTTNNNQQVTQHINTSNPNFAYKRSNRYVMAL